MLVIFHVTNNLGMDQREEGHQVGHARKKKIKEKKLFYTKSIIVIFNDTNNLEIRYKFTKKLRMI